MGSVLQYARDSLTSLVSRMGTERDKAATTFYSAPLLTDDQIVNAYRGSALSRNIVDLPAMDSCRNWRDWQAQGSQIEAIEAEERRLDVRGKVLRARTMARLLGGAAIFIGTGDANPAEPLEVDSIGRAGIRYLTVLDRTELTAQEAEADPASEWYGRPRLYMLNRSGQGVQTEIHPSRLVIFLGNEMPLVRLYGGVMAGWSDSILVSTLESIKQADGTAANIASLVFEAKVDVIGVPDLMNRLSDPRFEEQMIRRFTVAATGKGIHGTLIKDTLETYDQKSATFSTLPDIMMSFMQIVAGASRIPASLLLGQAPQGMNATGEGDYKNYLDRITSEQTLFMQPAMSRLDECLIRSALGARDPAIYYEWAPLWQQSEKEKADIFRTKADAARALAGTGGASPSLMPIEALSDALVNAFVEDGSLPGLQAAIDEYGRLSDQEEDEAGAIAALVPPVTSASVTRLQVAANDAEPRTLYVSRKVLNAEEIFAWAKAQGFETTLAAEDLHVTIAFSRTPVDWFKVGESWSPKLEIGAGGPRQIERFGKATVLLFTVSDLRWRHREIIEAGASWDHEDYQPHITISYGDNRSLSEIEPYQGEIILGPEIFAEVDDERQASVKEVGDADLPFDDAKRKGQGGSRSSFNTSQPRGGDGRWVDTGRRLQEAATQAGSNQALHVSFATVRRPAELSKLVGIDVKGFRHAASNQAMKHALRQHGDAATETARGQSAIFTKDFARIPQIVRTGVYRAADQRLFGPPRVEIHATVGNAQYTYVGEVRRGKRRIDMVTMWKR